MDFNSRPREGANKAGCPRWAPPGNFNSRPREGANPKPTAHAGNHQIFQFPPPRGGELLKICKAGPLRYFNSRPREGANQADVAARRAVIFQFPPPRGGERE